MHCAVKFIGIPLLVFAVLVFLMRKIFGSRRNNAPVWFPEDKTYRVPDTDEEVEFPSLFDEEATVHFSFIVPSYNESKRITPMLDDAFDYLHARYEEDNSFTYEMIIVCDGCKDDTAEVARAYESKRIANGGKRGGEIRVLELTKNRGKGGAVRRGMMYGRGKYLLMVDADGATKFSEIRLLEKELDKITQKSEHGIAIGSRAHLNEEERKFHRKVLMVGFNVLVTVMCISGIRDTQCGFKLFTRRTAQLLFPNLHVSRWAFDVELLYMSAVHSITVKEVPVIWEEIDGSTLSPLQAAMEMARDIVRIRLLHFLGYWGMRSDTIGDYGKALKARN